MSTIEIGELLYEYAVGLTSVTDFGITMEAIMSGQAPIPPGGARFDVWFEGESKGKIPGKVVGCDYLRLRADGRFDLEIRAVITTPEGPKIALSADGVCIPSPGSPVAELRENATLFTSSPEYAWVNPLQIWATGTVDLTEGVVRIKGYRA